MTSNDRFKIEKDSKGRDIFFMESSRIPESIDYLHKAGLTNVIINRLYGLYSCNLDFLLDLADLLEGLTILDRDYDLSALNSLHGLKVLNFRDNGKNIIDLANFPRLEESAIEFSPRLAGLENCENLQILHLAGFNPKGDDFSALPQHGRLQRLMLIKPKIRSLDGIGVLSRLEDLEIFQASNLISICAIKELRATLRKLQFENCKKINDFECLEILSNLEKLIITKSGEIGSLDFIPSLKKLSFLSFWGTNVLDGDLKWCLGIPYVGFDEKRHYSHKMNDFPDLRT